MNLMTPTIDYSKTVNTINTNPPTSQNPTSGGERVMRCAIYARVSTEMDTQRTSIENQIDLFREYVAKENWEIHEVYTDKQSGTTGNRPGLKKLIEDGKSGLYDVILAKELSRLARNGQLSYDVKNICDLNKIHIVCLDNSINTLEGNIQNFGLFAWMYENESTNSSRRNKAAKRTKANRGLFVGSTPPFGYYSDEGQLKIREDSTPEIVRRIFNEYLNGKGMDSIAKSFTAEKIPTPSQTANKCNASPLWHATTIKNILNNQHYCGDLVQNKTETLSIVSTKRKLVDQEQVTIQKDKHEAIIPKDTFQAVKKMLQTRTRTSTAPKKHLFTNVLYCEDCGKGMWYKANQKGYRCGGNIKYGDIFCSNRVVIREKELQHIIFDDLKELVDSIKNEHLVNGLQKRLNQKKVAVKDQLLRIENQTAKLRSRKKNYLDMYTDELITREELLEYRKQTDKEISQLLTAKVECENKLVECQDDHYAMDLGKRLNDVSILRDLNPKVLHSLVSKVTCTIEGNISINYTFVNPFEK